MNNTTPAQMPAAESSQSMADTALDYIRDRIVSGQLSPGDHLKERDFVAELGMSRVPIREALRSLATEGFVTLSQRRGAVVAELKPRDLNEIFEVREALEVQECALAARNATEGEIASLRAIVAEAEQALEAGNTRAVAEASARFHDLLTVMAHNAILAQMLAPLENRLHWLLRQNDDASLLCSEHRALAEAIAARDVERARRLSLAHVQTSKTVAFRQLFGVSLS